MTNTTLNCKLNEIFSSLSHKIAASPIARHPEMLLFLISTVFFNLNQDVLEMDNRWMTPVGLTFRIMGPGSDSERCDIGGRHWPSLTSDPPLNPIKCLGTRINFSD